jgi:hypothetical protein
MFAQSGENAVGIMIDVTVVIGVLRIRGSRDADRLVAKDAILQSWPALRAADCWDTLIPTIVRSFLLDKTDDYQM